MAKNYDGVDFMWTNDGDFMLGHEGDLADTLSDPLLAIAQDVYDRCKSDQGDFFEAPLVGATISDFAGEPNNKQNGLAIKERLFQSLQSYGHIKAADISIDTFPVSASTIAASVIVRTMATRENKSSRLIQHTFVYDYGENHVISRG
jgi:hypothetical protein